MHLEWTRESAKFTRQMHSTRQTLNICALLVHIKEANKPANTRAHMQLPCSRSSASEGLLRSLHKTSRGHPKNGWGNASGTAASTSHAWPWLIRSISKREDNRSEDTESLSKCGKGSYYCCLHVKSTLYLPTQGVELKVPEHRHFEHGMSSIHQRATHLFHEDGYDYEKCTHHRYPKD